MKGFILLVLGLGFYSSCHGFEPKMTPIDSVIDAIQESIFKNLDHFRARRTVKFSNSMKDYGQCQKEQMGLAVGTCAQLVFQSYRKAGNTITCRDEFPKFINCSIDLLEYCMKKKMTDAKRQSVTASIETSDRKKDICDDGGSQRRAPANITKHCDPLFPNIFFRCVKPFHDSYDNNRGDPGLCFKNEQSNLCVVEAMEKYCNKPEMAITIKLAKNQLNKKANHFCFKSQGGGDPQQILDGNFNDFFNAASSGALLKVQTLLIFLGVLLVVFSNLE